MKPTTRSHTLRRCLTITTLALLLALSATIGDNYHYDPPPVCPTIIADLASQVGCVGQYTSFHVVVSGTSLSFQWYKNNVEIQGATSAWLVFDPVRPEDAGTYYVLIRGDCGYENYSSSATLTVSAPPTATVSPSSALICPGGSVTLSASGASTYSWSPGTGLNTTVGPTVIASPSSTTTYTVTGTANGCQDTANVTVTVVSLPPTITLQPVSQSRYVGQTASFLVAANSVAPLTYQWRKGGTPISGATSALLTLSSVTTSSAGNYDVVVSNCKGQTISAVAALTVVPDTDGDGLPDDIDDNPSQNDLSPPSFTLTYPTEGGTIP